MKRLFTIVACILFVTKGYGQTEHLEAHYETAFTELKAMLEGQEPLSFKRAVFVAENAFLDNQLEYRQYLEKIDLLAHFSNQVAQNGILDYSEKDIADVRKKFAVYSVMKDSIPFVRETHGDTLRGFETIPFSYDFEDFFGEKDWSKMFVTKLLKTHTGNCHSLPFLYKIIAEEIGTEAHLALSPNHIYIKQWTNQTGWFNTELTSGQFPIDSWIMASGYIKLEAIQNGIFMDTLSSKQSISVVLTDLAQGYQKKFGQDFNSDFVLKSLDVALEHYPKYINALFLKAEVLKLRYENLMKDRYVDSPSDLWHDPEAKKQFNELENQYAKILKLGYRQMPKEMYLNWLMDIKEKDTDKNLERYTFEAPQPFKEYGQEVTITTLSKGKYQEFFDMDTVTQIGSIVLNRLTGKITHFIEHDTVYSEATLEPEVISRWLQQDPLAEEFYSWSPYSFSFNNPIRYSDPTGMAPLDVIINGSESQAAFDELQASVQGQLNLSMDENGKVTYTQAGDGKLSKDAQQLVNSIDDNSIVINVTAENDAFTESGNLFIGGAFAGNTVTSGENGNTVVAEQEVNPSVLNKMSTAHGKPGADMLHEVTEAYQGALISQKKGKSSTAGNSTGSVYNRSHGKATKQSGPVFERIYDASGRKMQLLPGNRYPPGVKSADWYVNDKSNNKVIIQKIK